MMDLIVDCIFFIEDTVSRIWDWFSDYILGISLVGLFLLLGFSIGMMLQK